MSASAHVLQLVRAHFRRDDAAFASAALALGRTAKAPTIQREIVDLVRAGQQRGGAASPQPERQRGAPPTGLLEPIQPTTFEDLLLEPSLQAFLDEVVVELEYQTELAARKLRARSRLLFCGPPGNGKTSSASALANALGVDAYGISIPRLVSKYLGATGSNLGELFSALDPGVVMVFDEIDAIGSSRGAVSDAADKEKNATVNVLLTLMDRHRAGVIVATTNRADILDAALLRRFDEQVYFPAPSDAQKSALATKLCAQFEVPLVDVSACENFDAVTKAVEREARRLVMQELLAREANDEGNELSS